MKYNKDIKDKVIPKNKEKNVGPIEGFIMQSTPNDKVIAKTKYLKKCSGYFINVYKTKYTLVKQIKDPIE